MTPMMRAPALLPAIGLATIATLLALLAADPGPDPVGALCAAAREQAGRGRVTEAVLDYNRAMATEPRDGRSYIGLAVLYEALNRSDLAIDALDQLRASNPEAPHLWCRLSEAYLGAEDVRGARELGAEAVRREPDCPRAFSNYGIALARSRFGDSAAVALQRARQLAPEDPGISEALMDVALQRGRYEEAAQIGEALLAGSSQSAKLQFNLGLAYSQLLRQPAAEGNAVLHLQRAMELAPSWFQPHAELGRLYQSLGRLPLAASQYEQAWKIDPRVPGVVYNLAILWHRAGDPRAETMRRQLPALEQGAGRLDILRGRYFQEPDNVANAVATAEAEAGNKQFPAALFRLRKVLLSDPANLPALRAYLAIDREARAGAPDYLRPGPTVTSR